MAVKFTEVSTSHYEKGLRKEGRVRSNRAFQKAIARIIAAAGGNAQGVSLPATRVGLDVKLERNGNRYVMVVDVKDGDRGLSPPSDHPLTSSGFAEILVKGHIMRTRGNFSVMINPGWQLPLIVSTESIDLMTALQLHEGQIAVVRGLLIAEGLVVTRFVVPPTGECIRRFVEALSPEEVLILARLVRQTLQSGAVVRDPNHAE